MAYDLLSVRFADRKYSNQQSAIDQQNRVAARFRADEIRLSQLEWSIRSALSRANLDNRIDRRCAVKLKRVKDPRYLGTVI